MSTGTLLKLLGLGGLFASAFVLLRVTAPAFGPVLLIDLRVLLAAAVLAGWAVASGRRLRIEGPWRRWLVLGALNAAIPFTLVAWAELRLPASLASVSVASVPLFSALFAAFRLREPLTPARAIGLVLGFGGVLLISGGFSLAWDAGTVGSLAALVVAAVMYAAGGIYAQQRFGDVPRLTLAAGNLAAAGILLLPLAGASLPATPPGPAAIGALVVLAVVSTALAFLVYFRLIEQVGASTASIATFFVPAFASLMGVVLLGEHVSLAAILGMTTVVTGAATATGAIPVPARLRLRWRAARA